MDRLIFEPVVPEPLLAALWTLAALFAAGYAFWRPVRLALWRRLVLAALHFVPLAGVLILLHRPTWVRIAGRDGGKPALTVLVDQSGSMDTEDVPGHASRYAAARGSALRHFSAWGRTFEVRVRGFDKALTPALHPGNLPERSPQGNLTDLAGALEGVLQDQPPPSALLVLSDGIHNAPGGDLALVARAARAAGAPVFTVALGSDVSVRDLGLTLSASEELTFIKQRVRVPVIVTQTGLDDTEQAVELLFGGQVVERKTIRFEAGAQVAETSFEVAREEAGLYAYEVRVPGVQGEALAGNNRRRFALRVVDERIRVLFLEGKPYWDGKFLARALREDPNVVLTTAVRMRENRMLLEPPQPRPEEEQAGRQQPWFAPADEVRPLEDRRFLGQFQVLILGRETDDFLTERGVENLRDWISRSGGQLVCARGRPAAGSSLPPDLARILPVAWAPAREQKFRVELTDRGRALALFDFGSPQEAQAYAQDPQLTLRSLPSLVTATAVEKENALSVVLARAEGGGQAEPMAVLSSQRYGCGRSLVLEGQGMWRWGFRPPEDRLHGQDLFHAFWANLVRWLAGSNDFLPSQDCVLRPGKPVYQTGESLLLYVMKRESAPEAQAAGAALPIVEILREDETGSLDREFKPFRVPARPVPRDPQVFQAEFEPLDEGHYRAQLVDSPARADTTFEVLPPLRERLDLRARPDRLAGLSQATDARALALDELDKLHEYFGAYVQRHKPGQELKRPAWDETWVFLLLAAWAGATWWLRRRWGAI